MRTPSHEESQGTSRFLQLGRPHHPGGRRERRSQLIQAVQVTHQGATAASKGRRQEHTPATRNEENGDFPFTTRQGSLLKIRDSRIQHTQALMHKITLIILIFCLS